MRKSTFYRTAIGALAIAASFTLAACGGGLAGPATTPDAGGASPTAGGTFKLGLLAPFSGDYNMYGNYMLFGAQAAAADINAAGGVLGNQVEIVKGDDQCDATQAANAANKLVSDGIVASVGGYCSGATLPTIPIFTGANIPMLISVANSDSLVEKANPNVFLIDGTGTQQATVAFKYVQKMGYQNLFVIDDKSDYSANLGKVFAKLAGDAGLKVASDSLTAGEAEFSAQVNKLISSGADFFYFTGYAPEAGQLIKQAVDAGYEGAILLGDGAVDKKVSEIAGQSITEDRVKATFAKTPDMLDDGGVFEAKYKQFSGGEAPGPFSIHSYDTVMLWATAAAEAGSTDMTKVSDVLRGISYEGLTGPIKFTENGSREGSGGFVIVKVGPEGLFIFDVAVD